MSEPATGGGGLKLRNHASKGSYGIVLGTVALSAAIFFFLSQGSEIYPRGWTFGLVAVFAALMLIFDAFWDDPLVEIVTMLGLGLACFYLGGAALYPRTIQTISLHNNSRIVNTDGIEWDTKTNLITFPRLNETTSTWMIADSLKGENPRQVSGQTFPAGDAKVLSVYIQSGDGSTTRGREIRPNK